jgi:hypothetical protein
VVLQAVSTEESTRTEKIAAIVFLSIMSSLFVPVLLWSNISIDNSPYFDGKRGIFKTTGVSAGGVGNGIAQMFDVFAKATEGITARKQRCREQHYKEEFH